MRAALLIVLALAVAGCRSFTYRDPSGRYISSQSLGNKTAISEVVLTKDGARMKGYGNDQVSGLEAAFKAGFEAGKGAAGVP